MNIRKLETSEVEFSNSVEPEDILVSGNYMCTDDPEADLAAEREILDRLDRGDESAWCVLVVEAKWKRYIGRAVLGGYSFPANQTGGQNQEYASDEFEQLRQDALQDLNSILAQVWAELQELQS